MMKDKYNSSVADLNVGRVAELLENFFEGRTSLADERVLYDYFSSDSVNPLFGNYTEMFRQLGSSQHDEDRRRTVWNRIGWWGMSVAAMVALTLTLGTDLMMTPRPSNDMLALYEGSYVIENGRKITDLTTIMPRLHKAEATASSMIGTSRVQINTDGMAPGMQETISQMLTY